jgi:glycosyltransferase involved in cell wall biosynthesis
MKISIVTISYNQGKYLKRCIDSVLSQGYENLEYIVVDPGSTDGSREIIESYGDKLISVFEKDDGPSDGLNKGFSLATGDVFAYINADDFFFQGTLRRAREIFSKGNYDIFCGHGWVVDEYGEKLHRCLSHKFSLAGYAAGNCVVMQQSTFFKRTLFLKAGGFNPKNRVSWDGELMVDMVIAGAKVKRVNDYLSCFRVYSTSISGSGDYLVMARVEHLRIAEKIKVNLGEYTTGFWSRISYRLSDPYYILIRSFDAVQFGKRKIPS